MTRRLASAVSEEWRQMEEGPRILSSPSSPFPASPAESASQRVVQPSSAISRSKNTHCLASVSHRSLLVTAKHRWIPATAVPSKQCHSNSCARLSRGSRASRKGRITCSATWLETTACVDCVYDGVDVCFALSREEESSEQAELRGNEAFVACPASLVN